MVLKTIEWDQQGHETINQQFEHRLERQYFQNLVIRVIYWKIFSTSSKVHFTRGKNIGCAIEQELELAFNALEQKQARWEKRKD